MVLQPLEALTVHLIKVCLLARDSPNAGIHCSCNSGSNSSNTKAQVILAQVYMSHDPALATAVAVVSLTRVGELKVQLPTQNPALAYLTLP